MKKIIFALFFLLLMCGCKQQKYTTEYLDVFDTYSTITIYTNKKDDFNQITKELHTKLLNLNKQFDIYNNYEDINNIKTINDNAGIKPVKVHPETLELIKAGKYAYEKTNKTVNIAMGSVLNIWHNYRENALNNNVYNSFSCIYIAKVVYSCLGADAYRLRVFLLRNRPYLIRVMLA